MKSQVGDQISLSLGNNAPFFNYPPNSPTILSQASQHTGGSEAQRKKKKGITEDWMTFDQGVSLQHLFWENEQAMNMSEPLLLLKKKGYSEEDRTQIIKIGRAQGINVSDENQMINEIKWVELNDRSSSSSSRMSSNLRAVKRVLHNRPFFKVCESSIVEY